MDTLFNANTVCTIITVVGSVITVSITYYKTLKKSKFLIHILQIKLAHMKIFGTLLQSIVIILPMKIRVICVVQFTV